MAKSKKRKSQTSEAESTISTDAPPSPPPAKVETPQSQPQSTSQDFEAHYLQRVTTAFADDIDAIRNASDFSSSSIPVLVRALKQGAVGFSEEDRRRIMEPSN